MSEISTPSSSLIPILSSTKIGREKKVITIEEKREKQREANHKFRVVVYGHFCEAVSIYMRKECTSHYSIFI